MPGFMETRWFSQRANAYEASLGGIVRSHLAAPLHAHFVCFKKDRFCLNLLCFCMFAPLLCDHCALLSSRQRVARATQLLLYATETSFSIPGPCYLTLQLML